MPTAKYTKYLTKYIQYRKKNEKKKKTMRGACIEKTKVWHEQTGLNPTTLSILRMMKVVRSWLWPMA